MINTFGYAKSPIGAKSYRPVWSEAECGDKEIIYVWDLAGFLPCAKIMTNCKYQIINILNKHTNEDNN